MNIIQLRIIVIHTIFFLTLGLVSDNIGNTDNLKIILNPFIPTLKDFDVNTLENFVIWNFEKNPHIGRDILGLKTNIFGHRDITIYPETYVNKSLQVWDFSETNINNFWKNLSPRGALFYLMNSLEGFIF